MILGKIFFFWGGGGRVEGRGGASCRGVRMDVNREVKFLSKFQNKKLRGGGGGVGVEWGSGGDVNQDKRH